ncbi:MAG TPA: hypothetical protein VKA84_16275 [Gemmatimonadaceae bacterium]|nr:hypothetical protein [Gemmatimonadaceae bacterium]
MGAAERPRWLERLRDRREHYKRANCNYWVFEEVGNPGSFVEFTEARDDAALAAARGAAPGGVPAAAPVYREVDLSQL